MAESLPSEGGALRVLLAIGDFPLLAAGYRAVIDAQPDMEVVAEVAGCGSLAEGVGGVPADVVVTECRPAAGTGACAFRTLEEVRAAAPAARIVAIECRCASDQFPSAIRAGANGFLARDARPTDVAEAVRCVARGETYVSPAIVTRLVDAYVRREPAEASDDPLETLDGRSREILRLAAQGHTNREIAETLRLSEQTVHSQRATLMEKLGVHDRLELLRYALRHGVIELAEL